MYPPIYLPRFLAVTPTDWSASRCSFPVSPESVPGLTKNAFGSSILENSAARGFREQLFSVTVCRLGNVVFDVLLWRIFTGTEGHVQILVLFGCLLGRQTDVFAGKLGVKLLDVYCLLLSDAAHL